MANPININSKAFWNNYVLTAQYDAGQNLGAQANQQLLQEARDNNRIAPIYRPVIINYTAPLFDFSSHVINQARPQTAEEREQERADWAKVLGSIVTVAGAAIFALIYKNYATSTETLAYTQDVNRQIAEWRGHPSALLKDIYHLTEAQLRVDELNASRISKYTLAALGVLASGVLMAIGGFAAVGALITIGQIALVASGVFAAVTFATHLDDEQVLRGNYEIIAGRARAPAMQGLADKILRALPGVGDDMQPASYDRPPQYVPLFPELFQADAPPPAYEAVQHPEAAGVEPSAPPMPA